MGYFTNNAANSNAVTLGSGGSIPSLVPVNGASTTASNDVLLAEYTDQGRTATLAWTQVGGGTEADQSLGGAVSGTSVYVTGYLTNSTANLTKSVFGGNGITAGTTQVNGATSALLPDLLFLKCTDQGSTGSYQWSQVGGGTSYDAGSGVAVSGTSVYVTGELTNNIANGFSVVLGGTGNILGTVRQLGVGPSSTASSDIALVKYTDNGSTGSYQWSQVGGAPRPTRASGWP